MNDPRQQVNLPSIMLIITGVMGLPGASYGIIRAAIGTPTIDPTMFADLPAEQTELFMRIAESLEGGSIVINAIVLATAVFVIFGALKMRSLESYGLAMAVSIIAMIPCLGPCCCIGIPAGIWSVLVLMKEDVKAAFSS